MADGYTDVELDTITIERPNGQKFEVIGIQARVYWDSIGCDPELIVEHDFADHVLDESDPWVSAIADAARAKAKTPDMQARIADEVAQDQDDQREAARERQYEWMHQAAE